MWYSRFSLVCAGTVVFESILSTGDKLPFAMKNAINILAVYDEQIKNRVERPISFVQFAETILKLIIQYKEHQERSSNSADFRIKTEYDLKDILHERKSDFRFKKVT